MRHRRFGFARQLAFGAALSAWVGLAWSQPTDAPPTANRSDPSATSPATGPAATSRPATSPFDRWEREMRLYDAADRERPPAPGGIVFVGSSSIRGWRTLDRDFEGLPVLNRGFGGSQMIDAVRYADRIVLKHQPSVVVVYTGENDIAAGNGNADDLLRRFRTFDDMVRHALPQTRVIFISLKPSPSRMKFIDEFRRANDLVKQYVETDPTRLAYVDVFTPMLGDDGQPRPELFQNDRLHMTRAGYELWTKQVRPVLDASH